MDRNAPKTKNWKAREDRQPPGARLMVTGDVETSRSNQNPKLTKIVPEGINPTILRLLLTVEESGVGNDVMGQRQARFREEVPQDQYRTVEIMWGEKKVAFIDNIEVTH